MWYSEEVVSSRFEVHLILSFYREHPPLIHYGRWFSEVDAGRGWDKGWQLHYLRAFCLLA